MSPSSRKQAPGGRGPRRPVSAGLPAPPGTTPAVGARRTESGGSTSALTWLPRGRAPVLAAAALQETGLRSPAERGGPAGFPRRCRPGGRLSAGPRGLSVSRAGLLWVTSDGNSLKHASARTRNGSWGHARPWHPGSESGGPRPSRAGFVTLVPAPCLGFLTRK